LSGHAFSPMNNFTQDNRHVDVGLAVERIHLSILDCLDQSQ